MNRFVLPLLSVLFAVGIVGWLWINFMPVDSARWAIDPATAKRASSPNSFLAAPEGATSAPADMVTEVYEMPPDALMARFAEIALADKRVSELTNPTDPSRTFVQRSMLMGFPDYVSVKPVEVNGGSSLIVFSRSQYGYSDWGVNEKRVRDWLSSL